MLVELLQGGACIDVIQCIVIEDCLHPPFLVQLVASWFLRLIFLIFNV